MEMQSRFRADWGFQSDLRAGWTGGMERNQLDDLRRSGCMGRECLISSLNFILKAKGSYDSFVCLSPSGG